MFRLEYTRMTEYNTWATQHNPLQHSAAFRCAMECADEVSAAAMFHLIKAGDSDVISSDRFSTGMFGSERLQQGELGHICPGLDRVAGSVDTRPDSRSR